MKILDGQTADANAEIRILQVNGGRVDALTNGWRFKLSPTQFGYTDAQIDDYGERKGANKDGRFRWRPGVRLSLYARFSAKPIGTAGFGFWNSPYGDPTVRRPALPQAVWFFYASPPNDLPFAPNRPGRGWFAATLNARSWTAVSLFPFAPFLLLAHQAARLRNILWPWEKRRLGIQAAPVLVDLTQTHHYRIDWRKEGCQFFVDDTAVLSTQKSPRGPLGFVVWLDNQFLVLTPRGRIKWGVLPLKKPTEMDILNLKITQI